MDITTGQQTVALDVIQKLAYATSEEQYQELYQQFCAASPQIIVTYYNDNWHDIRQEWCWGLKFASTTFMNTIKQPLRGHNGQLKEVISTVCLKNL